MNPYIDTFQRVARKLEPALSVKQIEAHTGEWLGAAVLKLQKHAWAKAKPPSTVENPGIFFSIWIDAQSLKRQRVCYNIHALKLRGLSAYVLESREFATAFRKEFVHTAARWPNVSVDYGPQTLMQGWFPLDESTLEADVTHLSRHFLPLTRTIDTLLGQRERPKP